MNSIPGLWAEDEATPVDDHAPSPDKKSVPSSVLHVGPAARAAEADAEAAQKQEKREEEDAAAKEAQLCGGSPDSPAKEDASSPCSGSPDSLGSGRIELDIEALVMQDLEEIFCGILDMFCGSISPQIR